LNGPGSTGFWAANGNDIYNTNSGKVSVGTEDPFARFEVAGGAMTINLDQVCEIESETISGDLWQSFTAGITGMLTRIEIYYAGETSQDNDYFIYAGEGTGGTLLHTDSIYLGSGWSSDVLSTPVKVTAGIQYTLLVNSVPGWKYNGRDPYDGGRASTNPGDDLCFRTYVSTGGRALAATAGGDVFLADNVTGRVGIGTTSPMGILQVSHDSSSYDLVVDSSNGHVGIGTNSPATPLDVSGDVNTDSTYKITENTVLSASGTENIFVGADAGKYNTGIFGTFVGYNAGYVNQGAGNTFLGYWSGNANTTGFINTFVGNCTGIRNETGLGNTFLGGSAGWYNTSGNNNTAIGHAAGHTNETGSGNVFIGYQAGFNEKESGNVFIGHRAGFHETEPNRLYIANSADNPPLIYGNFDTGRVGIGTTDPWSKLHVNGNIRAEGTNVAVSGEVTGPTYCTGVFGQASGSAGAHYGGYFTALNSDGIGVYGYTSAADSIGVQGRGGSSGFDFLAVGPSNTDYGTLSSIRWKKDIRPIDAPLGKVLRLQGVYFNWDVEHGGNHAVGMIAEEVGKVLPEIVVYEENGIDATGMDYSKLTPLLVEAVKALKLEVNELQKQKTTQNTLIEKLQSENQSLSKRLDAIESQIGQLIQERKEQR